MGDDSAGVADSPAESGPEMEESVGGDQDWEDADSSDGETFFVDPDGRVPFAGDVSFDFRSAPKALTAALAPPEVLARVVKDCQTVFTARAKKLEYSTGETFWMQADRVPRNSLERLALDIFEAHTAGARFNRAASGAEWWTQVIEDSDDIGWHWDKDYGMEAQGVNVHPCLATVTYLSTNGGPTVILEKRGPMACEDVRGVSGEASKAWISRPALGKHICFDGRYLHAAPADLALPPSPPAVVTPVVGRLRAEKTEEEVGSRSETNRAAAVASGSTGAKKRDKDGKPKATARPPAGAGAPVPAGDEATAAAPLAAVAVAVAKDTDHDGQGGGGSNTSDGSDNNSGGGARRVTFLVNVWLNHAPRTAVALPEETAKTLGRPRLAALLAPGDFVPPKALRIRGQEPAAETTTATATVASPGDDGGCRGSGGEPEGVGAAAAAAVEMRWEFGEVGGEAETHLRHEVLVPVPGVLLPRAAASGGSESPSGERLKEDASVVVAGSGAGVGVGDSAAGGVDGGSFCVEYPSASSRPRVSRMGADDDEEEEGSSSEEEDEESEEDEEEDEEEEEEEDNSSSEEGEDAKPAVDR